MSPTSPAPIAPFTQLAQLDPLLLAKLEGVDAICDAFEQAWLPGVAVNLAEFVTSLAPAWRDDHTLRLELACIDLEHRWNHSRNSASGRSSADAETVQWVKPTSSDYRTFLSLADDAPVPRELVVVEYRLQKQIDSACTAEQFLAAHPHSAELRAALAEIDAEETHRSPQESDVMLASSRERRFEIRCPQCHNPVSLLVDQDLASVVCELCGCDFNLLGGGKDTKAADTLQSIGHFELIERIGVGEFGSVWKARDTQLDRTVAVKIPRRGDLSPDETEKFLREARAAAQLQHPNIVAIHEVGVTNDTIFLVSDYIRGVSLSDMLSSKQLFSSREAATLCAKLASALHHAHQLGVIHRDIKPANVMIDAAGEPHIMDFGLAKREVGEVTMTVEGQVLGTPAYMSPEQARGDGDKANRRSDVYSLGVVLFELLTGELPFRGNVRMILHQVVNDDPPAPRTLNRFIPLDLQTICLKCLEKEPARRYATAAELAEDFTRYLSGLPIAARPVSWLERRWRWCKRNPAVSALSATALFLLCSVAVVSLVGFAKTRQALLLKNQAAETSASVSNFLVQLFQASDPLGTADGAYLQFRELDPQDASITAKELLDRGAKRIRTELTTQPEVQATLMETIGGVYRSIGEYKDAITLFREALAVRTQMPQPELVKIATLERNLAWALSDGGEFEEAEKLYRSAIATQERELPADDLTVTSTQQGLAMLLSITDQDEEAIRLMEQVVATRRRVDGPSSESYAIGLMGLAATQMSIDDDEAVQRSIAEAAVIFDSLRSEKLSIGRAITKYQEGLIAMGAEQYQRAAESIAESLAEMKKLLGDRHPYVLWVQAEHARALLEAKEYPAALKELQLTERIAVATLGQTHPKVVGLRQLLAQALFKHGDYEASRELIGQVIKDAEQSLGRKSRYISSYMCDMSVLLYEMQRDEEAILWAERSQQALRDPKVWNPADESRVRQELARPLIRAGRPAEAIEVLTAELPFGARPSGESALAGGCPDLATVELYGQANEAIGDLAEAQAAFESGRSFAEGPPRKSGWIARFRFHLVREKVAADPNSARSELEQIKNSLATIYGEQDEWTIEAKKLLDSLAKAGD